MIEGKMEAAVLRFADRVVVVTPFIGDLFVKQYKFLNPSIVCIMTNGFDPDDFERPAGMVSRKGFTLTYTGSVYPLAASSPILRRCVATARESQTEFGSQLRPRNARS
jgi:hypothetical protein